MSRSMSRSPWTALRPGVVQHGEFHSAEHAGGETVSMAITTVLSRQSARRVSLRILHWLKTKNIRIQGSQTKRPVQKFVTELVIWSSK
jgi:hypothetical protein